MHDSEPQLRDLAPTDFDSVIRVRNRSFEMMTGSADGWKADASEFCQGRRYLGVFDGDRAVAAARIWDFTQWWGGRRVPMAGIAGVVVAPDHRGRGVGSRLMRGILARSRELGFPLSALYPASVPVYRKLGYEYGGGRYRFSFPTQALRLLGGQDVPIREGGPADASRVLELVATVRGPGRESGMLGWTEKPVRDWLAKEETFCYLADDGFVVYGWDGGDLRIDELVAGSGATARALWSTVGSGASIAKRVRAFVSPQDPIHLMLGTEAEHQAHIERWMLRVLDPSAAVAARGWPPGLSLDLPLEIDDAEIPHNSGSWRLEVGDGVGALTRSESERGLRLAARGLAGWYAGTPLASLRLAGVASGGRHEDDGLLDAATRGPTPYMVDYF